MNYTIILEILVLKLWRKCKKDKTIFSSILRKYDLRVILT